MYKLITFFVFCFLIFGICSFSQEDVNTVFDKTLKFRGLTRADVTIPIEFFSAAEKSPTNDAKLVLPLVKDMMINPLRSMTWLDTAMSWKDMKIEDLVEMMFHLNDFYRNGGPPDWQHVDKWNGYGKKLGDKLVLRASQFRLYLNTLLSQNFTNDEIAFLQKNLWSIFEDSENDDPSNYDIFLFNKSRDSSIAVSKRVMDLLSKLPCTGILSSSKEEFNLCYSYYKHAVEDISNDYSGTFHLDNEHVKGDFYYYYDEDGIRIAIGGPGKNVYNGKFDFIIDVGGDDVYNIENGEIPHEKGDLGGFDGGFRCIIDLAGNDYYTTKSNFALAGGLFSSSFIFDKEGDDVYESKASGNLGASIGGLGLIYDESGNDTYRSVSFSEGAGCFGVGLIVDRKGNDVYIANSYSQGFGMTQGVGAIVENEGNDSYLVDSRSLDIGRYNDHYVSMCQGYGLGLRPYYAGGIGLIIEGGGNDIYNADIFGQGGAYWYSLGAIVDKSGHDKYNGYQYCQGAGIHLAVGLLKDYDGWDFYQSDGVSQGCGHDFGFGLLWDVKGNDNYSAYSLSQGAGNADGIGILIDESGTDGYLNKYPGNTRGYGNPRREYGSLGVFLDMSGDDYYSQPGYDSTLMSWSQWGVMNDYTLTDKSEQQSGDNFKVKLGDNMDSYTVADYYLMAKTIEPRFSLWSDFGYKKLQEDSIESSKYMVTRLGTDDHREAQVMRVMALKIQKSFSDAILDKLQKYLFDKSSMTQPEVSFACYIFGETKNPAGKEVLLKLTYDDNYRVRSSAINALGKINYDKSDADFINRVSLRLSECAAERSEKKLYNKDIAFALGNYVSNESFSTLMKMLDFPYYGARFTAAENLKRFAQLPMLLATDNAFPSIPNDPIPLIAFMSAITEVSPADFITFVSFINIMPAANDEAVTANLLHMIKQRRESAGDQTLKAWCDSEINELQGKIRSKVK